MKRITKNIIMSIILAITIGGMIFTMFYAKDNLKVANNNQNSVQGQMGTPPDMPNNNSNMGEPPDMNNNSSDENETSTTEETSNTKSHRQRPGNNSEQATDDSNMQTPPEKPDGESNDNSNMDEPPAKPDQENDSENSNMQEPQQMPGNDSNQQTPPDMTNMNTTQEQPQLTTVYYVAFAGLGLCSSLIILYLILSRFNKKTFKETFKSKDKAIIYILGTVILTSGITYADSYISNKLLENNTTTNNQTNTNINVSNITYSAAKEITSDEEITSGEYSSKTADENTILATGDIDAKLSDVTVNKTGDSDGGDATSFYGTNSAILAKNGANLTIKNATITTNATGANGVFSYGGSATTSNSSSDGTTINISDSKITTTKDNSGGIMTTGGGVMNATNLEINTSGTSSAAIRSDRGGGTVTVNKGTYTTTGQGSPAIYSTADITANNATLISKASEGVVIEGANSVTLNKCTLTDTNNKLNGQSTTYKNIFLYQSMSGDADNGTAKFTSKDSKITTNKGDIFYVTNTTATIELENNTIVNNDKDGNFLKAQKDSWGNSGSNGGNVTLTLTNQKATGNITIDSISTLDMTMKSSSYYEGAINQENTAKSISLKLDKSSKIKLTNDSYVTSFEDEDTTYSNIDFNGYKLYVNGKAIN